MLFLNTFYLFLIFWNFSLWIRNLSEQFLQVIGTLKLSNLWFIKLIMRNDIVQVLLILVSIINVESDSLSTESTSSTDSVEVSGTICFHLSLNLMGWNIIVDNKFGFWDVDSSRNQICCYQDIDLLISEFLHGVISFFFCHFGEHNIGFETCSVQIFVNLFGEIFSIYEDISLSHFTSFENFFYEIQFLFWLAFHNALFDVIEL